MVSVAQKFRQEIMEMALLYSMMTKLHLGRFESWDDSVAGGWNHLEVSSPVYLAVDAGEDVL